MVAQLGSKSVEANGASVTTITTINSVGIPTTVTSTMSPPVQSAPDPNSVLQTTTSSSGISGSSTTSSSEITSAAVASPTSISTDAVVSSASSVTQTASSTSNASTGAAAKETDGTVKTGTIAGAAVGAAIGGLLIGALIAWLILRKRSRNSRGTNRSLSSSNMGSEKPLPQVTSREIGGAALVGAGKSPSWMSNMPQPIDDNSLKMSVKTLFHQIELHVENFYMNVRPSESSLTPDVLGDIEDFDRRDLPAPILTLIRESGKPTSVIKRALAQCIVSNISLSDMEQSSFLPAECSALSQVRRRTGAPTKPGTTEAFSQWRVLTAYLRPESNPANAQLTTSQDSTIQSAAHQFSTAFGPWANPSQPSTARVENLIAIMRNAVQVGTTIFSQPAEFAYVWSSEGEIRASHGRRIVVTPALLKVRDEQSRIVNPSVTIVQRMLADL